MIEKPPASLEVWKGVAEMRKPSIVAILAALLGVALAAAPALAKITWTG
jgi:hypothetical protein